MGTNIKITDFIYPYFVIEGKNKKEAIESFPGVHRFSIDRFLKDVEEIRILGIDKILLFGVPGRKDALGSSAYSEGNVIASAVKDIKNKFPGLTVMTDVCLCAYTSHGHCGILEAKKAVSINNSETLKVLAKIALSHAEAGADYVAPSAMAGKQVFAIRKALDKNGFEHVKIMGYSAKFASNFYGPFRNAAGSAPRFGDRKGYQLDYSSQKEAIKEIGDDIKEGADIVMVKPALSYLDIIKEASLKFDHAFAAYNVSGEYALVKYAAGKGFLDEKKTVLEIITSIKRAGADLIISYHAKDVAKWLKDD